MTDKTQEALKAVHRIYMWACPAEDMPYSTPIMLEDIKTIRAALQKPEPVDVEKLKECLAYYATGGANLRVFQMIADDLYEKLEQGVLTQPPVDVDIERLKEYAGDIAVEAGHTHSANSATMVRESAAFLVKHLHRQGRLSQPPVEVDLREYFTPSTLKDNDFIKYAGQTIRIKVDSDA